MFPLKVHVESMLNYHVWLLEGNHKTEHNKRTTSLWPSHQSPAFRKINWSTHQFCECQIPCCFNPCLCHFNPVLSTVCVALLPNCGVVRFLWHFARVVAAHSKGAPPEVATAKFNKRNDDQHLFGGIPSSKLTMTPKTRSFWEFPEDVIYIYTYLYLSVCMYIYTDIYGGFFIGSWWIFVLKSWGVPLVVIHVLKDFPWNKPAIGVQTYGKPRALMSPVAPAAQLAWAMLPLTEPNLQKWGFEASKNASSTCKNPRTDDFLPSENVEVSTIKH